MRMATAAELVSCAVTREPWLTIYELSCLIWSLGAHWAAVVKPYDVYVNHKPARSLSLKQSCVCAKKVSKCIKSGGARYKDKCESERGSKKCGRESYQY